MFRSQRTKHVWVCNKPHCECSIGIILVAYHQTGTRGAMLSHSRDGVLHVRHAVACNRLVHQECTLCKY